MFESNKRKFLFKCKICQMVVSSLFEDEKDIKDIEENKMILSCPEPCNGSVYVLRD